MLSNYRDGLLSGGSGCIGAYTQEERRHRLEKFWEKRNHRVWTKRVKYDVRKNFADSRVRVKGRFVKKEEEQLLLSKDYSSEISTSASSAVIKCMS